MLLKVLQFNKKIYKPMMSFWIMGKWILDGQQNSMKCFSHKTQCFQNKAYSESGKESLQLVCIIVLTFGRCTATYIKTLNAGSEKCTLIILVIGKQRMDKSTDLCWVGHMSM